MTNLLCAVIVTLATNWTTVSRTVPVREGAWQAVYLQTMLNQVGTRVTNYVALVAWKGRTNEVVLESVADVKQERLERSVPEPDSGWGNLFVNPALNCYPVYNPVLHWETNLFLDAN